jgi:hypothetical protein
MALLLRFPLPLRIPGPRTSHAFGEALLPYYSDQMREHVLRSPT